MSLVLDTGTMKYRENPNQPWRPLVIKAGMNWESMADTYDPDNGTYEVGQYVLEEGMMYRCVSEITTPETWTPAHWTSVNVGDELSSFIIISDDQPTDETNKIWIAETTTPFGVQVPTMDDHNVLGNTLTQLETTTAQLDQNMAYVESGNTATRNYSGGEFISWKGTLYTANGIISSGQSFSAGSGGNLTAVVGGGLNWDVPIAYTTLTTGVFYGKSNGVVYIQFDGSNTTNLTNATWVSIGTLPAGYRPNSVIYNAIVVNSSANFIGICRVNVDGSLSIFHSTAGDKIGFWGGVIYHI